MLTYTFVPPPQTATRAELDAVARTLERVLESVSLDAIHLPDVRPDPRSPRTRFVPKLAPRAFARAMDRRLENPPDWLLDRSVADRHWAHQERWFRRTMEDDGYRAVVLVGGASREIRSPGPSVVDAARRIRAAYGGDVLLAGIAIPARRDEVGRLVAKTEAGVDLFLTQILGDVDSTTRLLMDYHRACHDRRLQPCPVVLSVAPVAHRSDIEFLESWGVTFDPQWRRHVLSSSVGVGWRSIDIAAELLHHAKAFAERERLDLSLGINVEHVRARNVELSAELLKRVADA